jgi:hypothetical protein
MGFARSADKSSERSATTGSKPRPVHIVAVGRSAVRKPTFSIGVADAHLFYANGVLSSNTLAEDHCYDMVRYGLMAAHWLGALKRHKPQSYTVGKRR